MAEDKQALSEYTVTLHGLEHTLLLDEDGAKAYGEAAKKKAGAVSTKKATPSNKGRA